MENNTNEVEQSEVELVSAPKLKILSRLSRIKILQTIIKKIGLTATIIIAVVIVVGVIAYFNKGLFIAATVNGSPVSRFAVIGKLEKTSGKDILDSLITKKLIANELDKKKVTVTNEEVDASIKKIEDQVVAQGGTLAEALAAQSMTANDLRDQITINLRMEKLLSEKAQVSSDEISKYIKDNKLTVPKGQETVFNEQIKNQLKSAKLDQAAQEWIDSLHAQASIKYFMNY
jgi:hypothetical protein